MREAESAERRCIVTRAERPADELIRFVVAPDGEVVPDIRRRLPGRGAHVTATAECVAAAERKHLFTKAFEGGARVAPGLADRVDQLLADRAREAVSLARKAGTAIFGYSRVEQAIGRGTVIALIHAVGASEEQARSLAALCRRAGVNPKTIGALTAEQLDLAFGRTNVIHAALLAGPASEHALARIGNLVRYRGGEAFSDPSRENPDP